MSSYTASLTTEIKEINHLKKLKADNVATKNVTSRLVDHSFKTEK